MDFLQVCGEDVKARPILRFYSSGSILTRAGLFMGLDRMVTLTLESTPFDFTPTFPVR